jgi:hypothetical protein
MDQGAQMINNKLGFLLQAALYLSVHPRLIITE